MDSKDDFVKLLLEWYAKQLELKEKKGVVQNAQVQGFQDVHRY